jgi:FkbM family methyltransferase
MSSSTILTSAGEPSANFVRRVPPGAPGRPVAEAEIATLTLDAPQPWSHALPCRLSFWPGDGGKLHARDNLAGDASRAARESAGVVTDVSFRGSVAAPAPYKPCLVIRYRIPNVGGPHQLNAVIFAAAVQVDQFAAVERLDLVLSCGDRTVGAIATPAAAAPVYMFTADRFAGLAGDFVLEVRVCFAASAVDLDTFRVVVSDCFVGETFDPYLHHPAFHSGAAAPPRSVIDRWATVRTRFVERAREINAATTLEASQQFIDPILVHREGEPDFAMLLGTLNSLLWYARAPCHDQEFFTEFGLVRPGDVVLDCGAHAGERTTFFGRVVGPRGKVIAFDPFPQNNIQIEANAALNGLDNITVAWSGVGAARRTVKVSNKHQNLQTEGAIDDAIAVKEVPLDDYVDERPTFMKMDIEGFEVFALRGAQRLLRTCKPRLFIEVHTPQLADFGVTLRELFAAIPDDLYAIRVKIDRKWRPCSVDMAAQLTGPFDMIAMPK